jgi:putative hydrolase of the HAD superfamily
MFDLIAFDADDTLWHSESLYSEAQDKFEQLLAPYHSAGHVGQQLHQTEMRNLQYYGYGIKGFALSLIETAIELSQGRISGGEIQEVIDLAKDMLTAEVQLLDHAQETVTRLAASYPLMMITKGDLFDQEAKIARSGLRQYFRYIEIVSDKTHEGYATLLARYHLKPSRFLMVGNSLRSDILPVVALGGWAVHIPYHIAWAHENVPPPQGNQKRYFELEHLGLLPALIEKLKNQIDKPPRV